MQFKEEGKSVLRQVLWLIVCGGQNEAERRRICAISNHVGDETSIGKSNEGFRKVNRLKAQWREDGGENQKSVEGGFEKKEIEEILAERS